MTDGQCVGCSFAVDRVEGILVHIENHDVTYVAVARAPIEEIELVRRWVDASNGFRLTIAT